MNSQSRTEVTFVPLNACINGESRRCNRLSSLPLCSSSKHSAARFLMSQTLMPKRDQPRFRINMLGVLDDRSLTLKMFGWAECAEPCRCAGDQEVAFACTSG